jgi:hypothetical protein
MHVGYTVNPDFLGLSGKREKAWLIGGRGKSRDKKSTENSAYDRFKMINHATQLHTLIYAFFGFTYSTQNKQGDYL